MHIEQDDLSRVAVHELLREHLAHMHELSPPEQVFALDVSRLRAPDITFWTAWEAGQLLGCVALKELDASQGELKSMRTPTRLRGHGAARALLRHIIATARQRGYTVIRLETGTHPQFGAAQALYRNAGFAACGPFAGYQENPHSLFMELRLV